MIVHKSDNSAYPNEKNVVIIVLPEEDAKWLYTILHLSLESEKIQQNALLREVRFELAEKLQKVLP